MTPVIRTAELLRFRASSQHIVASACDGPDVTGVVRRLLAVQAQDFGQALWALGLRVPGSTRGTVLQAPELGEVVRSWPMRGTLHFVVAADLRWMLSLTAARTLASASTRQRQLGLDRAVLDRACEAASSALAGGGVLSRNDVMTVLEDAGISTVGQRGYHIIWYLAQIGLVCWGPPVGTQQALVLLDEWVPEFRVLDRQETLREFALRYFAGHGPATVKDFAWWSKLTMAEAKAGLESAREKLTEFSHEGVSYWMASEGADTASASPAGVQILPGFDEYLLGYQDRSHVLAPEHADLIVPGGNGIFLPTIVSRGRVVGTWSRASDARGLTVTPNPFERLSGRETALFARAARTYARWNATDLLMGKPSTPDSR